MNGPENEASKSYVLDEQIGFIMRQAMQRHAVLFLESFADSVTPTQWASLAKLYEKGPLSQNYLGRLTAMDVATIKGVIDRLMKRGFVTTERDRSDARRHIVQLTEAGREFVETSLPNAFGVTEATLAPLNVSERATLVRLLAKLR